MREREQNLGCLLSFLKLLGVGRTGQPQGEETLPYRVRDDFLSPAEHSFFGVLQQVIPPDLLVCPKVRVADILYVVHRREHWAHANRIDRKHVDFLLVARASFRPRVALELDDASHQRPDRAERDEFLDRAFQAAGLPLLHVPAQRAYNAPELKAQLAPYLTPVTAPPRAAPAVTVPPIAGTSPVPSCPKCGVPMVLRTSARGATPGQPFYGCRNYPQCRQVVPVV